MIPDTEKLPELEKKVELRMICHAQIYVKPLQIGLTCRLYQKLFILGETKPKTEVSITYLHVQNFIKQGVSTIRI